MEKVKEKAVILLGSMKEGLENLECVLSSCMPEGDWGLFEGNKELQKLWRWFQDEIFQGNGTYAVIIANRIFQVIGPQQVAENFWKAVKMNDYLPFEKKREFWEQFRKSINSDDGMRVVRALDCFIEKALEALMLEEPHANHG